MTKHPSSKFEQKSIKEVKVVNITQMLDCFLSQNSVEADERGITQGLTIST